MASPFVAIFGLPAVLGLTHCNALANLLISGATSHLLHPKAQYLGRLHCIPRHNRNLVVVHTSDSETGIVQLASDFLSLC